MKIQTKVTLVISIINGIIGAILTGVFNIHTNQPAFWVIITFTSFGLAILDAWWHPIKKD